jgi:hypothetical protein
MWPWAPILPTPRRRPLQVHVNSSQQFPGPRRSVSLSVRGVAANSGMQARTPRIMRFSLPHDRDGCPCLPTRSRPTSPPSPPGELPVAAARWPASWAWRPPRCWPGRGRSPRSPNGPPTRPNRSGPRSCPPRWPRPLQRPGRGHHPPHTFASGRRPAGRRHRRLAGQPGQPPGSGPWRTATRRRAVAVDGKTLRGARPPAHPAGPLRGHALAQRARRRPHPRPSAPSRWSRCKDSGSRTPPRSSRSPARPATCTPTGGRP